MTTETDLRGLLTSREGFSAPRGPRAPGVAAVLTMLAVGILPFDQVTVGRRAPAFKRLYDSLGRSLAAGGTHARAPTRTVAPRGRFRAVDGYIGRSATAAERRIVRCDGGRRVGHV